jgi:hypothetical protein
LTALRSNFHNAALAKQSQHRIDVTMPAADRLPWHRSWRDREVCDAFVSRKQSALEGGR